MKELASWKISIEGLIEQGRFTNARQELTRAYLDFPDASLLTYLEARIAYYLDEHEHALSLLEEVMVHNPEDARFRLLHFQVLLQLKRYFEAERTIISLIADFPEEAAFYSLYSLLMLRTRHIEKSIKLANEAMRLDSDDYHGNLMLALQQCTLGHSKPAKTVLQKLLAEHPESEATVRLLIAHLSENGQHSAALRLCQELLQKNPLDLALIEAIVELKALVHPLCRPFYILSRFGLAGSALSWFAYVIISGLLISMGYSKIAFIFTLSYLAWAISSWIVPPILRKWYSRGIVKC